MNEIQLCILYIKFFFFLIVHFYDFLYCIHFTKLLYTLYVLNQKMLLLQEAMKCVVDILSCAL